MGLLPRLVEAQLPWGDIQMRDTNGRQRAVFTVATQQALMNEPTLHIPRSAIESILVDSLNGEVKMEYGTTVSSITEDDGGVECVLSNGAHERVDLVIGADGVGSTVRQMVFGPDTLFRSDFGDLVVLYHLECSPDDTGTEYIISGVGRMLAVNRMADGLSVLFVWTSADLRSELAADLSASVRHHFGDMGWAVPELLKKVATASSPYFGPVSQIKMDAWSKGRVVLLGDAAWCTGFYAGLGASLAVGGAELLGDLLERHPGNIAEALRDWESQFRPLVLDTQEQARRVRSSFFVSRSELEITLRMVFLRIAGNAVTGRLMRLFMGVRSPK
jgi:2-polyprenyl-6-methoxyphenol hydroxylase-like FAD-dependent oxidoreductase